MQRNANAILYDLIENLPKPGANASGEASDRRKTFKASTFIRPNDLGPYQQPEQRLRNTRRSSRFNYPPSTKECRRLDIFRRNDIDPRNEVENHKLLSEYITEMGKIRTRAETQLTIRSQRLLGKAIKRSKMMGIMPMLSNLNVLLAMARRR